MRPKLLSRAQGFFSSLFSYRSSQEKDESWKPKAQRIVQRAFEMNQAQFAILTDRTPGQRAAAALAAQLDKGSGHWAVKDIPELIRIMNEYLNNERGSRELYPLRNVVESTRDFLEASQDEPPEGVELPAELRLSDEEVHSLAELVRLLAHRFDLFVYEVKTA